MIRPVQYENGRVILLDQRKLPREEKYSEFDDYQSIITAIKDMVVRGAPAIGLTGAAGLAVGAHQITTTSPQQFIKELRQIGKEISSARPTAVNLSWAIELMEQVALTYLPEGISFVKQRLNEKVSQMIVEDIEINERIGAFGSELIQNGDTILTHCNAGALATGGFGTALGVIRAAWQNGKKIKVIADETRPLLQGARLTVWELMKEEIPVTLITDNMAGYLMSKNLINKVIVGADRIATNGDFANKIGTYSLAVLAINHGIPFYVAAPISTVDPKTSCGSDIPIEERNPAEITHFNGSPIAPEGVEVKNPAFDITPYELISAIITEKGIIRPPFSQKIAQLFP